MLLVMFRLYLGHFVIFCGAPVVFWWCFGHVLALSRSSFGVPCSCLGGVLAMFGVFVCFCPDYFLVVYRVISRLCCGRVLVSTVRLRVHAPGAHCALVLEHQYLTDLTLLTMLPLIIACIAPVV